MVACLPSLRRQIILLAGLLIAGCDNTEDTTLPYSNNGHTEPEPEPESEPESDSEPEPEPIDFCETVNDPGTGSVAFLGGDVPHLEGVNQYGEVVNLCELGGTPMIVDISTSWCGPCRYLSEWIAGERDDIPSMSPHYVDQFRPLREMVDAGDVVWVTILTEGRSGTATEEDCVDWHDNAPHELVNVIADPDKQMETVLDVWSYPTIALVDENFRWRLFEGNRSPLVAAVDLYGPEA